MKYEQHPTPKSREKVTQTLANLYPHLVRVTPAPDRPHAEESPPSVAPWVSAGLDSVRRYFVEGPNSDN